MHDIHGTDPRGFDQIYAILYLKVDDSGKAIGYTYDYHAGSTCSFYLEGDYNLEKNLLKIVNTKKINKSFLHARGMYKLSYEANGDDEFLVGRSRQKGVHGFVLSFGGLFNIALNYRKVKPENYEDIQGYDKLKPHIESLEMNTKTDPKEEDIFEETPIGEVQETEEEVTLEEPQTGEVKKAEELGADVIEVDDEKEEIEAFTKSKENRKNELITSHNVASRKITIEIFDNSRQDEDRISIYVNDSLIEYNLEVTKNPKVIEFILPEDKKIHKVLFVANNMGKVPPNTAKIKYTVDDVSYEEELFTNLRLSKYLEFVIN
ncbi:hypothetical protein [Winogradskyella sp.]|uniref:hypothetical protein n=1 Tax=Winogradskyella sp. TaxID=1883156 RepID=UPI002606E96D|nr:hypothetical protein [Winogradskyella sp.]